MDQQQQQQYSPQSGGYGYGGGGAPQQYPPSEASTGGGFGGRAMAPPMTNYNTQGNAGATTIPNFGGSHVMGGPPRASGAPNYYGGYPTTLPPPHVGGFQVGGAPMPNNGGNESFRSSQTGNSSKGSRISMGRDGGEEDPSIFYLLMTGISRQIKSCVANSCGGAESGDEDEEKTMGTNTNAGRVLVQNQADVFGNVYSGQMLGGKRDGLGTIHYAKSGDRYEGMWQGHQPHGDGKVIRGDGTGMFEGRWQHGTLQMVKNGKFIFWGARNVRTEVLYDQRIRILI